MLVVLLIITAQLSAQFQPIPMDSTIRFGQLENGLTYYIKHNDNPKQRAEFHIAQKVGAILEEDNQNGLAHFLEHMAFNGTKNFPDKGIINYFETLGIKFGVDINAYTSLDKTVYRLSNIPTTRKSIIDSALLVMHNWSSFISLKEKEIDNERGVIMEEWRTRNTAWRRMWKQSQALKFPNSQYAKRDVIGDTAIIQHFSYQALRDYYHKWYHPDLQAVIVVGDIDVDRVEKKIKEMFSDIPKSERFGIRPIHSVEDNKEPIFSLVTDPEASRTQISITYKKKQPKKEFRLSQSGFALSTIHNLISSMLSERFQEISMKPDAPFVGAYGYYSELVKAKDAFTLTVVPKEGKEKEALKALIYQGEKMSRYGFTNAELERAKTNYLANYEKSYNERDTRKNKSFAEEYIRHFLDDEPVAGIEYEYNFVKNILPQLSLEVINQVSKKYITDDNIIIDIQAPEKEEVILPSQQEVLAEMKEVKNAKIEAKKEETVNKKLMEKTPKAGKVVKFTTNKVLGTQELTLSNGVQIIIKPTTFKKDEIRMDAVSYGGMSKVHNINDLYSAALVDNLIGTNGVGNFSIMELKKVLTGKKVSVTPYLSKHQEGMSASSTVKDLESMLQLVFLDFTAPRKDDDAFKSFVGMAKTILANSDKNPDKVFGDSVKKVITDHDPRTILVNAQLLDKINQDKIIEIYKERFANPADFTFFFVGNIDANDTKTRELLCTYLGGLKTENTKPKGFFSSIFSIFKSKKEMKRETFDKVYRITPRGVNKTRFEQKMENKKASNRIQFTMDMPYTLQNIITLDAISSILDIRYTESIREREGGAYGVGTAGRLRNVPNEEAVLIVQFSTDPVKQEKLIKIVYDEIDEIIKKGPRKEDLQKIKENLLKQYAQDVEQNGWWLSTIIDYYDDNLNYVTDYKKSINNLTPQLIQETLREIRDSGNLIEVVMVPQK